MAKDLSTMIDDVKLNIRVGALIKYQDKILIEQNNTVDFAVIPGGRIKTEENSKVALIREIEEELGIDISNEELNLSALIENFFEFDNKKYHELYFVYKVELNDNYDIKDGMLNLDNKESNYYLLNNKELESRKILPGILKEIVNCDEFKHYIIND